MPDRPFFDGAWLSSQSANSFVAATAARIARFSSVAAFATRGLCADVLRTVLAEADGLALNDVIVPHPTLGDFNVYQWVELIASHRRRHAAQIEEILALLTGASAPSA